MTVISLQPSIVYGPVRSRRLGPSLGVNVLPFGRKMCSFDCLYCQYGRTPVHVCTYDGRASLPSIEEVDQALRTGLAELSTPPGYITFSGNGEPTLHPDFPALATLITRVRDALCPGARTAILSNSVGSWRPEIRRGLSELDVRIMKLDAATEEMLQIYNRPCPGVTLEQIAEGLRGLDDVVIQALFTRGPRGNAGEDHIRAWLELVGALRPGEVQIYSLDRPAPSEDLLPVSRSDLERLAERGRSLGIPVTAYGPRSGGELPLGRS